MIFLIEYNRKEGQMVIFKRFKDSDRTKAEAERLDLELKLNRTKVKHEVVILEALNLRLVKRTHRRYFESISDLAKFTRN